MEHPPCARCLCLHRSSRMHTHECAHAHAHTAGSASLLQISKTEVEEVSQLAQDHAAPGCKSEGRASLPAKHSLHRPVPEGLRRPLPALPLPRPSRSPSPGRGSHSRSQPGCTVLLLAAGRRRAGPSGQHDFAPRDLILRQPGALGRHSQGAMAVGRGETLLQSSAGDWPMSQCELSPAHVLWRHKPEAGMQPAVTAVSSDMWEASSRRETEPPSSALTPEEPLPGTGARPYSTGDSRRERA